MQVFLGALFFVMSLAVVSLVGAALLSGIAFGGARRNSLPLLTSGVYALLTGGVYVFGLGASYYAKQDNAYLGNGLIGLLLLLAGVWLLAAGLIGAGMSRWLAGALALAGAIGGAPLYGTLQLTSYAGGVGVALYTLGALVASAAALLSLGRVETLARALRLGVAGAVAAIAVYALVGLISGASLAAYAQFGVDQTPGHKPPVLEGFSLLACALSGVAVYYVARRASGARAAVAPPEVSG